MSKRKVLVAAKRVIDSEVIRLKPDKLSTDTLGTHFKMNDFDERALQLAVDLKNQKLADEIIVVTIGPKVTKYRLDRKAFAFGVDRFIHVTTTNELIDTHLTSTQVAPILNYYIQQEKPDLILLGKLSTDNDSGITCSILSALSGIECINNISKIQPIKNEKNDSFLVERDTGYDIQTVEMKLPFIMSCDLSLNEPQTPDMFRKPKNKKIEYVKLSDIKSKIDNDYDKIKYKVNMLNIPNLKRSAKVLNSADEIMAILKDNHFI